VDLFDAVVIGGGPAGAVCAARLAAHGRKVIVLERDRHPRFHLGESLLPASLGVLDAIGVLDEVRKSFIVKRGARFVQGSGGASARAVRYAFADAFRARWDHAFEVPRDRFDEILFRRAGVCGAETREGWEATRTLFEGDRAIGVEARAEDGTTESIAARVVVDASGREAVLSRAIRSIARIRHLDRTALFTQVRGAWRDTGDREGDIQIIVFGEGKERGWFWLIPFLDGRTSVGAVVSREWVGARRSAGGPERLFAAAVDESPTAAWMLSGSETLFPPRATADFSFRAGALSGTGWVALGDATGFVDPLFSTGAHLAMHGGLHGADAINAALDAGGVTAERLQPWEREMRAGADLFIGAVQAFYSADLVSYLFAEPQHPFLRRAITSMLSGDVFDEDARWVREMRSRFPADLGPIT
jgi:flavin-dependent dehydrogenase